VADQAPTTPDPLAMWREWVSQSERQWNAFLNQAMTSDAYGQTMGRFMEMYVGMQKQMADTMGRYVTSLNLPARTDVLALGDRLAAIEDRLAGIELRLARLGSGGAPGGRGADSAMDPLRPPRTKRPPAP